ncbi:hypothetical protein GH714_018556 [Hevea brasiliensis]|uniref:CRAL/TRIO N-terminal domain-containing protein n=1 Tax=Hevea brasiliensis TaxID=3981 RepID=A0A6A6M2B4_HEVBR|nr:hypothetical protein GH714_018556 [Hevea brasiliensis]
MEASSPISIQQTPLQDHPSEPSPKPYKKSFVTTLMEAATLRTPSFKEDTYFISHLKSSEKKALLEFRDKLSASYDSDSECSMWGIPLMSGDEKADVILLKFLRARDFRVPDALRMLDKCLSWRKEFGADSICEVDLGFKELEGVVAYMHGYDREGHPVCYNAYGVFKDKEMYERIFGDEEKLKKFLRWRVQVLERGIKLLNFKPGGVNSIIQVTDLKDMPKRELRVASNQILSLFKIIILKWCSFIRPEDIPVQYGGLCRPSDLQNGPPKPASEFAGGATITWDIVVGGWDLEYSAEFVPNAEGSYTIAVEKIRQVAPSEEAIHNSYTSREAGKMVLSVDNTASKRKKSLPIDTSSANPLLSRLNSLA